MVNNRLTYFDRYGNMLWQERKIPAASLKEINIDWMNRGYFYAYSRPNEEDLGGFGRSRNRPQPVTAMEDFSPNKLSVTVRTEKMDTLDKCYKAFPVFIANTTKSEMEFEAQDSRLYMKVQARNPDGIWTDIEYLPSSWCGNSYHILTLDRGHFWKFATPAYHGSFPTRLRIELTYIDPEDRGKEGDQRKTLVVYSNEYDGSINPAQFWRKNVYYPAGLMDPYND